MVLKPQDLLVLLKLVSLGAERWNYATLAEGLGMSSSEVHAAVKRALAARLAAEAGGAPFPLIPALGEFVAHGVPYVFVPERGGPTRGMPTAHAATPLRELFATSGEFPPVWPDPSGEARGLAFSPLYPSVPKAARADPKLYELLALVDAVRDGRARERAMASSMLKDRLQSYGPPW